MNKCNLNKNDIIIILVIFIVFCIFMYVNNYNTYENFQIAIKHKSNDDIIIGDFLENLTNYLGYFKELNQAFYDLINLFKTNQYVQTQIFSEENTIHFNSKLNKIKDILNNMKNSGVSQNDAYIFQDFFKIQSNHIFNEYTELFNSLNVTTGTTATGTNATGTTATGTTATGTTGSGTTGSGTTATGTTGSGTTGSGTGAGTTATGSGSGSGTTGAGTGAVGTSTATGTTTACGTYNAVINDFFNKLKSIDSERYNLSKLDDKISSIDLYFKNFKSNDKYNVMEIFKDFRYVLISLLNNFKETKNIIVTLMTDCGTDTILLTNHNTIVRQFRTSNKIIDDLIGVITNSDSTNLDDSANSLNNLLVFETKFCEKFKKLNKPDKSNIIFKKFTNNIIQQKLKYVKKLETNIKLIQDEMTEKELNDYNLNRLRTNDQASKQYTAIKQAINNIKTRDKIKINLT